MPFTLSHAAIAPIWGRSTHSTPATTLAVACGSIAPDVIRHGLPARLMVPSHTVLAAFTVDTLVGVILLALTATILGPALEFIAPGPVVALTRPLQPTVPWRNPKAVILATSAGALLHILVDLPSHAPADWMQLGPFHAEWLRRVPFSAGGDPYPWYYINRLGLSVLGLAILAGASLRVDRSHAPSEDRSTLAWPALIGVIACGTYGAIVTRFYTNGDFERTIVDIAIDIAIGATVGLAASLVVVGTFLRLSRLRSTRRDT